MPGMTYQDDGKGGTWFYQPGKAPIRLVGPPAEEMKKRAEPRPWMNPDAQAEYRSQQAARQFYRGDVEPPKPAPEPPMLPEQESALLSEYEDKRLKKEEDQAAYERFFDERMAAMREEQDYKDEQKRLAQELIDEHKREQPKDWKEAAIRGAKKVSAGVDKALESVSETSGDTQAKLRAELKTLKQKLAEMTKG